MQVRMHSQLPWHTNTEVKAGFLCSISILNSTFITANELQTTKIPVFFVLSSYKSTMPTLPLPIVLAMLATPFCLGVPTTNKITKRITTPYFKKYTAIGDSYSSGIGAGQYIDPAMSEGWKCSRFTEAYPQQLHKGLNDPDKRTFNFKSCAGATAEQIREQHVDQDADLITLSAGGNNVGFSNLINGCVYRFLGYGSPACEKAMDETEAAIRDDTSMSRRVCLMSTHTS